ncbi:MAG: ArsR/SmtB family transcription factor [Vulcanimicrobiota bacterium]
MELSNYARIFKALSNEQRLKIFLMIYRQCCSSTDSAEISASDFKYTACCPEGIERAFSMVCECLNLSRSTISHHFKELQNAGIISCEREGQTFRCRINEDVIKAIQEFPG